MLLYNALLSAPFLFSVSLALGDFQAIFEYKYINDTGFLFTFLCSCILGFVINFAVFVNTSVNSPLTQTVTGQFKDILVLFLGIIIFRDVQFSLVNAVGVALSLVGSFIYAYTKFKEMPGNTLPTKAQKEDHRESVKLLSKVDSGSHRMPASSVMMTPR